eukprot:m.63155 g.63155  ORF g.63155 m.63155 type:complete len:246 (-) comp23247_c0_seq1:129-866(-)
MTDPWSTVKEEVVSTLKQQRELYSRWQQLLEKLGPSSDTDEFEWVTTEIKKCTKSITWDLEDLNETIAIVEESPARFSITHDEIDQRRQFVAKTTEEVKSMKAHVTSQDVQKKLESSKRNALLQGGSQSRYAKLEDQMRKDNDAFIGDQGQKQTMIIKEQDTQLDEVGATIGVLKNMGVAISDELDDQAILMDDFENEMENTTNRLNRTMKRLDKTLNITKDKKQSCCICLLVLVLIILISVYAS